MRVQQTKRTGWYLRVLTPGEVAAGDELILESRPEQPIHSSRRLTRTGMASSTRRCAEELLQSPQLSEGWKEMLRRPAGAAGEWRLRRPLITGGLEVGMPASCRGPILEIR